MLNMIPGMAGQVNEDDINKAELKSHEAILSSMTRKERANHLIIGPTRRKPHAGVHAALERSGIIHLLYPYSSKLLRPWLFSKSQ